MAVSNWGILFWTHYTLVAVCTSLAVHRFNLPLTFRSCYYPIFGAYTWGWIGDVIDGFASFITIGCSSILLEIAVSQLTAGFVHLGWIDDTSTDDDLATIKKVTVWLIVFISSASVISGLRVGIRLMANAAMSAFLLLLIVGLLMDDTTFLLNLCVQEVGYFLQTGILQLNVWTDAFAQLRAGSGRAIDGKAAEEWWVDAVRLMSLLQRQEAGSPLDSLMH